MKLLRQFALILIICFAGQGIQDFFKAPIPGSVIGMVILFIFLCLGIIKLEMIEEITTFLLDHLAFFFVPAGVGLIAVMGLIKANGADILGISVITTILVMVVTGHTVQLMKRGKKN
ncbi:CidA/LrgA family protein [Clostridium sp. 19966]|uniref:CidA/LrgA family protein n=1 Tax=Clostridium sp. 19966 TaxID=2768166 RepID=UPI0028DE6157|nr:CidA/LrgA family protein [Clostridium sp. 19966]MDT8717453.1 CidA/LrgA family protein [Clostridium sp. 19966]